jgi:sialidase-1
MKHFIIYKEAGLYISFPHIVYLPNKQLGLVFRKASEFSHEAANAGLVTHHDPNSSIEMIFSQDHGQTWSKKSKTIYQSKYGVNDPSLTVLKDGGVLLRFVALEVTPTNRVGDLQGRRLFSHRVEHGLVATVVGNIICRSDDSGYSWRELGVADVFGLTNTCSRDPILELPDQSLLMPVYSGSPQRSEIAYVIRSFDKGLTWHEPTIVMCDPKGLHSQQQGVNHSETSLLHLGNGEIFALTRSDESFRTDGDKFIAVGGIGELRSTRSLDGGLSWEYPKKTGILGTPGALTKLQNGILLATYGYRRIPFGVRCVISRDNGSSWEMDREIVIRSDAPTWDCGYPFTIELITGDLLTVYYLSDDQGNRHIAGTIWPCPQF